ncbi:MAG: D-amino-acid transaminase [Stappiaceae bacterium]
MSRIAYVNGRYIPHAQASVHIEDRGYQFADGIYEVCEIREGYIIDETGHLDRLERSLHELEIAKPMSRAALKLVMKNLIRKNRINSGMIYLQVTRGVAPRDHVFPGPHVAPSIVMTAKSVASTVGDAKASKGVAVISLPDNRWDRVDIKTVSLLPNVLAKQKARETGAFEAWFVDGDDKVTEGSSTNAWIINQDGVLITRPAEHGILRGITRATVLRVAEAHNIPVEERSFSVEEAQQAREAFITAASTIVMPVVKVNDAIIGNGQPGSIATELRQLFHQHAEHIKL